MFVGQVSGASHSFPDPGSDANMAIGIKTHHPLPRPVNATSPVAGAGASELCPGSQPGPEPVEIPSSAAAVRPRAAVQPDPSSIRARLQAPLAGDPPSADPNTQGQVPAMTSVWPDGVSAPAAEGFWLQYQSPEVFDAAARAIQRAQSAVRQAPPSASVIPVSQ